MKYYDIAEYSAINAVKPEKVAAIAASIRKNGWNRVPILVIDGKLITGSHRLAALRLLEWENDISCFDFSEDIAEDVSDIVEEYCAENDCTYDQLPFDNLREIFAGTWVECYKDYLAEW